MLDQLGWDYFCKTGSIDGYLLYRQAGRAGESSDRDGEPNGRRSSEENEETR